MKKLYLLIFTFAIMVILAFSAHAETQSGYTYDPLGAVSNIKWTVTEEAGAKVVTFEIDPTATDKAATTVLCGVDPTSGVPGTFKNPIQNGWGQQSGVTKAVIKEGITKIEGGLFTLNRTISVIELPTSLKEIYGNAVFEGCRALNSIYIAGNEPVVGTFDFSLVEAFTNNAYALDGCAQMQVLKFSPDLVCEFGAEFIKEAPYLTELTIPAGVTRILDKSFSYTDALKTLTILGSDTQIASDVVFNGNATFPAIKAKAGSKAEEFAKANGYTFIDLDTGEETKGTKPAPTVTPSAPVGGGSTAFPIGLDAFNKDECTAYGYIGGQYYDTYWVYYQETKTLKFFTNKLTGWNETGRLDKCEDGMGWIQYKQEIECIEIGPQLAKVTQNAFAEHTALKEVKLGPDIKQIDADAFKGCTALATVWYDGGERVEGRCDLTKVTNVNNIIAGTSIKEVLLAPNAQILTEELGSNLNTILSPNVSDALIAYAQVNGYNLKSTTNPAESYEFYVQLPEDAIMCGNRCGYTFDEATGTLTIHGAGAIADIINYYGGGAKSSPWFSIKQQIKHVVITEKITAIGKYSFAQCQNLETVQIPDVESFEILNSAFEKCTNLKSVYRAGTDPIEGTLDLRNVHEISSWTFAYDYLIANVILSPQVAEIGSSVFEENIALNLAGIYGTPGSYAETYASENGKTFYDISANTPQPVKCELPEGTGSESEEAPITTQLPDTTILPESESETDDPLFDFEGEDTEAAGGNAGASDEGGSSLPIIIAAVVAGVIVIVAVVVIILRKKGGKKA